MIPIRIDVEIPAHRPEPALPLPPGNLGVQLSQARNPIYYHGEITPIFRLRDFFLWNLWETLITPEQFARIMVQDLDLPSPARYIIEIASQIRTQLEEHAPVALHPIFSRNPVKSTIINPVKRPIEITPPVTLKLFKPKSARPSMARFHSSGSGKTQPNRRFSSHAAPPKPQITASVSMKDPKEPQSRSCKDTAVNVLNPDDAYRCVLTITVSLAHTLYTDKFEWSLLHPTGLVELFASQTTTDLGMAGEWTGVLTHAIFEAVHRCKKDAIESGILPGAQTESWASSVDCATGPTRESGAGWRFNGLHGGGSAAGLGEDWAPKLEKLSREEIERREGDRERRIRRLKREQARFSTVGTDGLGNTPGFAASGFGFGLDANGGLGAGGADTPLLGRGERKRKKRLRSHSPGGRGTPDLAGNTTTTATGGMSSAYASGPNNPNAGLTTGSDADRRTWRCNWCALPGTMTWNMKPGPDGPRTLCAGCGYVWGRDRRLMPQSRGLHAKYDFLSAVGLDGRSGPGGGAGGGQMGQGQQQGAGTGAGSGFLGGPRW